VVFVERQWARRGLVEQLRCPVWQVERAPSNQPSSRGAPRAQPFDIIANHEMSAIPGDPYFKRWPPEQDLMCSSTPSAGFSSAVSSRA
jgi:hypothetical protein